jgi:hypothetical protein
MNYLENFNKRKNKSSIKEKINKRKSNKLFI